MPLKKRNTLNMINFKIKDGATMNFTEKEHNYIETDAEREEGHVDTIKRYFDECLSESRLGCDPGIDIPG
jgi:ribosome-associated translation inhibitor RaiA